MKTPRRTTRDDLDMALARAHILRGLAVALGRWDEVAVLAHRAESTKAMRRQLQTLLGLDEQQAQSVMDMQLRRVASLEREKVAASLLEVEREMVEMRAALEAEMP